jgi:hypothetical protein
MRFEPQRTGCCCWVNSGCPPPSGFIAVPVNLAMVSLAQWDNKLIADLAAQSPALGKTQMMSVRGAAATNQARTLGHIADVVAISNTTRFRQS